MRSPNPNLAVIALILFAFPEIPRVQATTIEFTDMTFENANWETNVVVDTTPDLIVTAGQSPAGSVPDGNPGDYRSVTHQFTRFNTGSNHRRLGQVYDPAVSGPIMSIDFSMDLIQITDPSPTDGHTYNFLLFQNGEPYAFSAGDILNEFDDWTTVTRMGVLLSDILPRIGPFPLPDFSATGAPITFGYGTQAFSALTNVKTITSGLDNWRVTIRTAVTVPEPSTILLFLFGLVGLRVVLERQSPKG